MGKNLYKKKLNDKEFAESCRVNYHKKEYTLYLHPDDASIVISSKDTTGTVVYQGLFYSAYRK